MSEVRSTPSRRGRRCEAARVGADRGVADRLDRIRDLDVVEPVAADRLGHGIRRRVERAHAPAETDPIARIEARQRALDLGPVPCAVVQEREDVFPRPRVLGKTDQSLAAERIAERTRQKLVC